MLFNQVVKNRRNVTPSLTERYIANIKFILIFGIVIPVKCNHYRCLNLPDCKVTSKSKLYSYYVVASKTVYLFYNVYGNDLSVLHGVLNEKKCFDAEECETALLLRDTVSKLLRLKD